MLEFKYSKENKLDSLLQQLELQLDSGDPEYIQMLDTVLELFEEERSEFLQWVILNQNDLEIMDMGYLDNGVELVKTYEISLLDGSILSELTFKGETMVNEFERQLDPE